MEEYLYVFIYDYLLECYLEILEKIDIFRGVIDLIVILINGL